MGWPSCLAALARAGIFKQAGLILHILGQGLNNQILGSKWTNKAESFTKFAQSKIWLRGFIKWHCVKLGGRHFWAAGRQAVDNTRRHGLIRGIAPSLCVARKSFHRIFFSSRIESAQLLLQQQLSLFVERTQKSRSWYVRKERQQREEYAETPLFFKVANFYLR